MMTSTSKRAVEQGIEILVVEDSPTQAAQLAHLLEGHGYQVEVAADGKQALAAVRRRNPTLIVSDIVMPEMDGFTLCREIKSKKTLRDIPVVLLSAMSSAEDVIKGLQCGADNFIRKPYDEKDFLSRIEHLLANRELQKSGKIELGLKIRLDGEEYLITSERQQILDLLISVYQEAVHLNGRLTRSYESLNGLYRIAVDLNASLGIQSVGENALTRAMELPGVRTGWIFLCEGEAGFRVAATRALPPALETLGSLEGDCQCRLRFRSGELDRAVNVFECERLQKAKGDTQGLRCHASVPLWSDGRKLGVLNLAGDDEGKFSDEELKILHGVGNQVAVALERASLYEDLEKKVEERTAALQAANEVKDRFLSVMSHELRTPLSVVMGYAGMVKEGMLGKVNPKQEEALMKVLARASDQLQMINEIMQTTQLDARAAALARETVDVSGLLRELGSDYEFAHDKRDVALVWDYPAQPVMMLTDLGKLKQILQSLINNAIKFTDEGTVTVTAVVRDLSSVVRRTSDKMHDARSTMHDPMDEIRNTNDEIRGGRWVELVVKDTGIGVSREHLSRIFDKFYQVDSSETRLYGGVGLGLYLAKKFTELLGGSVNVESEPGKGSTFTVRLPWEK